ncbi:hypothetical protein AB0J82_25455 [Asanoa sp. NPDC049518]|uniref:hypothetical protein n=1 Tax=unclassified Asanoa TaxID=2685164 RepID=UPI00341AB68B
MFAAVGSHRFSDVLERFLRLDDDACTALLVVLAVDAEGPSSAPGAHPMRVSEDTGLLLARAVERWPARFEAVVAGSQVLRRNSLVIRALSRLRTPTVEAILVDAAGAGEDHVRAAALDGLLARHSAAITGLLPTLLGYPYGAARAAALGAAPDYGDLNTLPILRWIAGSRRCKPWDREKASQAIEAISLRLGR